MVENNLIRYAAESIGTLALVVIGTGTAVIAGEQAGNTGISLAFGLVLLGLVYAIGRVSGCHVNPAVTVGMWLAGRIKTVDGLVYIVAQSVGAIAGSAIVWAVASGLPDFSLEANGLGQNGYGDLSPAGYSLTAAFVAELVLTALFVFVVAGASSRYAPVGFGGIAIGFALAFAHLVGIPVTGTSVNPARSLGPAVLVGGEALSQVWLFWVAPLLGGLVGAAVWRFVIREHVYPPIPPITPDVQS